MNLSRQEREDLDRLCNCLGMEWSYDPLRLCYVFCKESNLQGSGREIDSRKGFENTMLDLFASEDDPFLYIPVNTVRQKGFGHMFASLVEKYESA